MRCYQCGSERLELASLWPVERRFYIAARIVMRRCQDCGLEQNHYGNDESIEPEQAAQTAPSHTR